MLTDGPEAGKGWVFTGFLKGDLEAYRNMQPDEFERIFDEDNVREYQLAKRAGPLYYLSSNRQEFLVDSNKLGSRARNAVVTMCDAPTSCLGVSCCSTQSSARRC
jgi:hypothetical protein